MLGLGLGLNYSNYVKPPYILDQIANASGCYSLRQLKAGATKSVRVRKSGTIDGLDIGFVEGILDIASLLAFADGGDVFVTTWYDQSKNEYHQTQATAELQPRIVTAGEVEINGFGVPSIYFDGSTGLRGSGEIIRFGETSLYLVATIYGTGTTYVIGSGIAQGFNRRFYLGRERVVIGRFEDNFLHRVNWDIDGSNQASVVSVGSFGDYTIRAIVNDGDTLSLENYDLNISTGTNADELAIGGRITNNALADFGTARVTELLFFHEAHSLEKQKTINQKQIARYPI